MSIRNKVLLGYVTLIIIPIIVIGVVGSVMLQTVLQKKYTEQSQLVNSSVSRNIATIFKDATASSDQSMLNSRVQDFLNTFPEERDIAVVPSILNQTFLMYGPLDTVTLYTLDGAAFSRSKSDAYPISMDELEQSGIGSEINSRRGISKWLAPYEHGEITRSSRFFTQLRVINDLNRQEPIGYVSLQYDFKELNNLFSFYSNQMGIPNHFLLVNSEGLIVYDNQELLEGSNIYESMTGRFDIGREIRGTPLEFAGTESLLTVQPLEMKDLGIEHLSLVTVIPMEYVTGETGSIIRLVGLVITIILLLSLFFNIAFVNRYIRFIIRMMNTMKLIEIGDLSARVKLDNRDETGSLARSLNRLAERVGVLIEEVKQEQSRKNKAELMLLQAQIKPHFIMNTLESINALNMRGEKEKVSQMVYRLGENLHLSFQEQVEITLEQEIGYLLNYFEIQKVRFGHLFDYEVQMPPELGQYSILKFTLQPLVENSIQHGLEDIEHRGYITVRIEEHGACLRIWVEDNGTGISNATLQSFHFRKSATEHNGLKQPDTLHGGVGVMNVADRLRLHYGKGYGMFICSLEGQGTVIQCLIPKRRGDLL